MADKRQIKEGFQPAHKGYKPSAPTPNKPHGGYQPATGNLKLPPKPPPKKI